MAKHSFGLCWWLPSLDLLKCNILHKLFFNSTADIKEPLPLRIDWEAWFIAKKVLFPRLSTEVIILTDGNVHPIDTQEWMIPLQIAGGSMYSDKVQLINMYWLLHLFYIFICIFYIYFQCQIIQVKKLAIKN